MKEYYRVRARKDEALNMMRYFPEKRYLRFFWATFLEWPIISCKTYDAALEYIIEDIIKNKVTDYDYQFVDQS